MSKARFMSFNSSRFNQGIVKNQPITRPIFWFKINLKIDYSVMNTINAFLLVNI